MKTKLNKSPRTFEVNEITIKDWGQITLEPDEMVTFVTRSRREYDFAAKEWGFYVGPSVNARLKNLGFRVALVVNEHDKLFVHAVEEDKMREFKRYLKTDHNSKVLCWLDEWLRDA